MHNSCIIQHIDYNKGNTMHNIVISHKWKRLPGITPSVVEAAAVTGQILQAVNRGKRPLWILDYEFAPYGSYRVKTVSAPWNQRQSKTAHLYPPNTLYWEDTRHASGKRSSAWIVFTGGHRTGINRLVQHRGYARFLDPEEKLGQTIRRCAEIGERLGDSGFWETQSMLCEMLHLLLNSRQTAGETYTIPMETDIAATPLLSDEVDAFLKERIAEKITLKDIARHLHVSISLLSHRYKEETGFSPISALIKLRINYSKSLLLKGYPLKAIAKQLGFVDAFYFSKTFKHIEGISPREFLKNPGRQ